MIRGFLSGVLWGTAVSALGLGAVSQLAPLPVARIAADASAVKRVKPALVEPVAVPELTAPEAVVPKPEVPDAAERAPEAKVPVTPAEVPVPKPAPDVVADSPATQAVEPPAGSEFAKPLPDTAPVAPAADVAPAPNAMGQAPLAPPATDATTQTDTPSVAPKTGLAAPKPLDVPREGGDAGVSASVPAGADDGAKISPEPPGQLTLPQADNAPAPAQDPEPAAEKAPFKPLPEILPVPELPAEPSLQLTPDAVLVPDAGPVQVPATKSSATLEPTPSLDGVVDGVTVGRLPTIGDAPAVPEGSAAPAAENAPVGSTELVIDGQADVPPLQKYARAFDNVDAKPLFSIILIDTGGADVDRAALAALPFPVTFALDPLAPNAAAASAIYRAAGQEIIMVATGIPAGATASDLEVTFQAHAAALPEAVAVIDTEFGAFQADRPMATQVVPILKAQGRGLISWDRGLNAADQVAEREGLPSGMVFRKLDGKGENKSAVRRALDRAAFKAAQDGRVMVIGQTLPETVAALMEWAVKGRSASVALAPVSAVLTVK
ncbi:MAG: divergent polysaccharide deacetylase family protein [Rhodoferax sp.]|nr:divergent polysaccharide deacetylase family protein [Pseudorhodobacter sp.]